MLRKLTRETVSYLGLSYRGLNTPNKQLIQFVEKPASPPHDFAIPGIYFGNNNFFKCFNKVDGVKPSDRGEYEISSPFQWLIDHKYNVMVEEYNGKWLDPGKFNDWLETNQYLLKNKLTDKVSSQLDSLTKISGKVAIGKNCSIKNCVINGPTAIGDDVKLENCQIGPNTSIYHHCQLFDCKIENSVLMDNITIKNLKKPIKTSFLGPHCEIVGDDGKSLKLFIGEMAKISF